MTTTPPTPPPAAALTEPLLRPTDLAHLAGVGRSYECRVLAGEKPASQKIRQAAEKLTGLPADVLFGPPASRQTTPPAD